MPTEQELNAHVDAGISRLYWKGPENWSDLIGDLDTLDTQSSVNCPLARIFGSYLAGMDILGPIGSSFQFGFAGKEHNQIWKARIQEIRRPREVRVPERVLVTA